MQTVRSKYAAIRNIRVLYIPTSYRTAANNGEKKKKQTSVYRYIAAGQKRKPWKWLYFGEMPGQPAALRAFFTELGHPLHRRFHLLFVIIFFAAKRNTPASHIYIRACISFPLSESSSFSFSRSRNWMPYFMRACPLISSPERR